MRGRFVSRRNLAVAVAVVMGLLALLWQPWRGAPAPGPGRIGCIIDVALEVPVVQAAPVYLASGERLREGRRSCRLQIVTGSAIRTAPLVLVSGSDLTAGLLPFLLVAQRAGALLVGRERIAPHFLWHSLEERVVVLPHARGDLGAPLVRAMVALHQITSAALLEGLAPKAFTDGTGDYVELPLLPAERLVTAGKGFVATDLGIQGGPLPAALLAARVAFAQTHPKLLTAAAVAVYRQELALDKSGGSLTARWPRPALGAAAAKSLAAALTRGRYDHLWPTDPRIEPSLFTRLDIVLKAAGMGATAPANPAVLEAPAETALRRLAPVPSPRGGT